MVKWLPSTFSNSVTPRRFRMAPIDRAAVSESHRARQKHGPAGKSAQMASGFVPVARLRLAHALDFNHAVPPDHPVPLRRRDRHGLAFGEASREAFAVADMA